MDAIAPGWGKPRRPILYAAIALLWLLFLSGSSRELLFVSPRRPSSRPRRPHTLRSRPIRTGTATLPPSSLVALNLTSFQLSSGQCVQRALALPALSCSPPRCNTTRYERLLRVLTNRGVREWVGYLRFELAALRPPAAARLVDAELQLVGSANCHRTANFTHQLHVLRAQLAPSAISLNRKYPRRLAAQWSNLVTSSEYRIPLNLNGKQLLDLRRHRRLGFVISEKHFGEVGKAPVKTLKQTCGYWGGAAPKPHLWPRLVLSYSAPCCDPSRRSNQSAAAAAAAAASPPPVVDEVVARPAWIAAADWARLPLSSRLPMPWHPSLARTPAEWVLRSRSDAAVQPCVEGRRTLGGGRAPSGGQRAPPADAPPAVSFVVAYKDGENMTAECLRELFACAAEVPSAEYIFVDDGSTERTGELPALLGQLSRSFGIRYELSRYAVSVGFTLATSEAARRANGTYLLFLNNDAFVQRNALRAMYASFTVHANVGAVGGKLVRREENGEAYTQEAGAIIWKDATGAWFLKNTRLHAGKANEVNHRLDYVRETDYVSAAFVMVPRALFLRYRMFDVHFSPGYYEDTDLSFTMHANGHRVLYQPFAVALHNAHSTYKESMEQLMERNRHHFISKWSSRLRQHMPPCNLASACQQPAKTMYTHLAATRMYSFRMLWIDQVLPEPDRDSGSVRTLTMLKLLLGMRVHVSIATVQRSGRGSHERYARMLQFLGVHVIPSFRMLRAFTVREPYDFILIARRDTYAAVRETLLRHYPNTLVVYDTVDLHFVRERQRRGFIEAHRNDTSLLRDVFGTQVQRLSDSSTFAQLRELELDAVSAASVAIVVSEAERAALLRELAADGREEVAVAVVGNAHEPEPITTTPFEQRGGLVFVGNFNHLPNRDAVLFFARSVMPRLLRIPKVRDDPKFVFHVVGANNMPEAIRKLNSSRVLVHGYVRDLRELYAQMRISVAPLRWGAGVKGKVNTAHALGVPVVGTSVALDGMHAVDGVHALVADTPAALAAAVLRAYFNASTWRRLTRGGRRLLETRFSASRAAAGLLQLLAHLRDANTLMGMKSLALSSAPPRIYSDLRAAAALGGYYFNFTNLAPHLELSDDPLPANYSCTPDGVGYSGVPRERTVASTPGSNYYMQRIAASF
ncbi:hypothetical protein AB1Y20_016573 [Prymnesium parvum]|uniref:Glycosyltransferase 2-like domain-containing protein n=1 Tax=Prymnesium parvum TaxID=97485 RepID=A0AB34IDX6_PRYPA